MQPQKMQKATKEQQEPPKKRPGRPYIKENRRDLIFQAKLSAAEYQLMMDTAKAVGVPATVLFRQMINLSRQGNQETPSENAIPILVKGMPTYLTREQAKDLFSQLSKLLI